MEHFLQPRAALTSPLLWVVATGPDSGQALPAIPGIFGRLSGLSDPQVSRQNLHLEPSKQSLRALPFPGSTPVYKMWKTLPWSHRIRRTCRLKPGARLKLGATTLRLSRRPSDLRLVPPPAPRQFAGRTALFMFLPLLLMLGLGAFLGWRLLVIVGIAGAIALVVFIRRALAVPTPEKLWLAAATPLVTPSQKVSAIRVFSGRKLRRRVLQIQPGETLCFTGEKGADQARWVIAQAVLFGQARLSEKNPDPWRGLKPREESEKTPPQTLVIRVFAPGETPHLEREEVGVSITTDTPPPWAQRIFTPPPRRRAITAAWFSSLMDALGDNPQHLSLTAMPPAENLPDLVDVSQWWQTSPEAIDHNWQTPPAGLCAQLGVSAAESPWVVDLVKEGPHALVAGTTGAGKSELLTTWLLALALRYSPRDLRFILLDYKGGAAFAALGALPHTHGVLTDLAPQLTARALASLEAFLKQRETVLSQVKARDLEHYHQLTGQRLPRVLIVVDEFRALATDHPETLENLIRLATHGRSLGLHLILATQKPGGVVNGQILANTNLRIALRVRSAQDSTEILSDTRAADLPPIPGRLYWEGLTSGVAQAAWCGKADWVHHCVDQVRQAWEQCHENTPLPEIWRPDLPLAVPCTPGNFALLDFPHQARQTWRLPQTSLGIFGNPGSGRTTALATLTMTWLRQGRSTVVLTPDPSVFWDRWGGLDEPVPSPLSRFLTVFAAKDLWKLDQFMSLAANRGLERAAVAIDRADLLADELERLYPGQGVKRLETLLSETGAGGYALAFTAPLSAGHSAWGALAGEKFVLCPRDTVDLHSAGIESNGVRGRLSEALPAVVTPGRGVWQIGNTCATAQIGLPNREGLAELVDTAPSADCPDGTPTASRGESIVLTEMPKLTSHREMPRAAQLVTLGWSSLRRDWLSFSPTRRHWVVDDLTELRPLVAQLKREYRRLGYQLIEAEDFELEHINRDTLVIVSKSERNTPNLNILWEPIESSLKFDLTFLELRSPGIIPGNLTLSLPNFTNRKVTLTHLGNTIETRHRAANCLDIEMDFVRKLQVIGGFSAIYREGSEVGGLVAPSVNVTHIT
ncbi:FtsK/SpoIIIE domain-containing protein [uncultured Mobiluncus sp.]|uniref:FtsK/SpoIIIE domain-containing protein n=1 Tax=uncultured Mobiluncus sp. TaxID=293425 RepID=UPI0025DFE9FC|nr:FtsK/SpoIIIE domain-containing protein [uncultured Mobiluncus sp.]